MAFRRSDLQEAFFVPGNHACRAPGSQARLGPGADHRGRSGPASHQGRPGAARGCGTPDALEEVLRPGYFGGTLLRPGELIYVSARRRKRASGPAQASDPGDIHMALLMVAKAVERGAARSAPAVRRVQGFGCPEGIPYPTMTAAAPLDARAPVKRGRGRPPGSRKRKNGALPALLVN